MTRWYDVVTRWGLETHAFRKLLVGAILATVLFLLPAPGGLTVDGKNALALFALIVYLWATEALPLPVTALGAGVGLVLLGIVDSPNQAWTPYAQDTIFFLLGSLILADAITKTEADRVLAARLLGRLGGSTRKLLFGIIAISAISAMFISNHAVAAVMLPLVVSILRATGMHKEKNMAAAYILAIALGAGIAGLGTPSGGSRNIIILGYLDELYGVQISYLEWTIRAAPITLALIPVGYLLLRFLFKVPDRAIQKDAIPTAGAFTAPQKRTLLIMALTVVLWIAVGTRYGLGTIAIIGAILLFLTGILDWVDTRKRIAWGVPLIYGAALTMGQALNDTGAAEWLALAFRGVLSGEAEGVALVAILILSVILTNTMSDGGTAAVLGPVALSLAAVMAPGDDTLLTEFGMITAIGAAYGYLLVVANPANVITYSSGLFTSKDLLRVGVPMTVISIALTLVAVYVYWPMLG